jgi:hypothetical protein
VSTLRFYAVTIESAHPPVTEEVVVLQPRPDGSLPLLAQEAQFALGLLSADQCGLGLRAVAHMRDHAVIPDLDGDPVGDLHALQQTADALITAPRFLNARGPIVRGSPDQHDSRRR